MAEATFKLGTAREGQMVGYHHANVYRRTMVKGIERLEIAPREGHVDLMFRLAAAMPEPFGILYVLLVPRGGGEEGRYQSADPLSRAELNAFLHAHRAFFEGDARHHLWTQSVGSDALLVYDQHDLLYAYGPLDAFETILRESGLTSGEFSLPFPHTHHYHDAFDAEERALLSEREWIRTPLTDSD